MSRYTFYFSFLMSLASIVPSFGSSSSVHEEFGKPSKLRVYIINEVEGLDLKNLPQGVVSFEKENPDNSAYVLKKPKESDYYVMNLEIILSLLFKNGESKCIINPLPINGGSCYVFSVKDKAQIDRISVQVQGIACDKFVVQKDKCKPNSAMRYRYVSLGSAWYSLLPDTTTWPFDYGWPRGDTLYAYFKKDLVIGQPLLDYYQVLFGNPSGAVRKD